MTTQNSLTPQLHGVLWNEVDAGVLLVDSHNRILESNPAANHLLEIRERPLVGQTLLQITLSYELLSLVTKVQKSGLPDERELRITKESSPLTLHVRAVPIPNENLPSHSLIMLLLKDVSELRRLETIRRDFVANVSHELRTPLTSIRAMAETLQEGAIHDEEVAERFVLIIQQEVERLTRLLEDLLVLSHAESKPPERVQFALDEQIKKVVERLRPQADKVNVTLNISIPPRLIVKANPDQIEQVLINLVDNAIKYTSENGNVYLVAESIADDVRIRVSDSGVGIMSQDLPRIFERFYRVDKARSRHSGGTGLGLAIVKNIVEMHGGMVTVESEYGHGSTFTVVLPNPPELIPS